ncbi:glycosylated lysosomal membrane protein [Notechis scutatus]|uniref:Glycosylated lysosomal membrane protein n=1 Tax=Notechis scutatus TaxID=8663 RepID=A0A6J1VQI9_9SAUR|nr:glycosylated lysosomal membrane protein [Notechis scutatus]
MLAAAAASWAGLALLWAAGGCAGDAGGYRRRLWEYNGSNLLDPVQAGQVYPSYNLGNFTWASLDGQLNETALSANFQGSSREGTFANGSISFKVTAYEEGSRDRPLPRLLHSANSSKVEFAMEGVVPRGNHSRFALEILAVEEGNRRKQLQSARSIDDEYTPTIFEMAQLTSEPHNHSLGSSFLQWKTAAYNSKTPRRENTVHCQYYPLQAMRTLGPEFRILQAYFGEDVEQRCSLSALNISFGSEDSEDYSEKRYLSWSALVGFGEPPREGFSVLVIGILAVALGTPAVLLIVGSLAVLTRQQKQCSEYEPIN